MLPFLFYSKFHWWLHNGTVKQYYLLEGQTHISCLLFFLNLSKNVYSLRNATLAVILFCSRNGFVVEKIEMRFL